MTATATEVAALTRDDLNALKLSEVVSLHHREGVGTLVASIRNDRGGEPRIFTVTEQRLFTEVNEWERKRTITVTSHVSGYAGVNDGAWHGDESATCFEMFHGGYRDDVLRTVVDFLRPGDKPALHWRGDAYSNGYTKAAHTTTEAGSYTGLHVDDVRLRLQRANRWHVFVLDVNVCPDNSARMVRRHGGF